MFNYRKLTGTLLKPRGTSSGIRWCERGEKDVAKVVQQADNVDLYLKLIDLSKQALDLQAEVLQLHEENAQLKKRKELEKVVVRHKEPVVTRSDDTIQLYYCAHCWDNEGRLFQVS